MDTSAGTLKEGTFMDETIKRMVGTTDAVIRAKERIESLLVKMRGRDTAEDPSPNDLDLKVNSNITDQMDLQLRIQGSSLISIHAYLEELEGLI